MSQLLVIHNKCGQQEHFGQPASPTDGSVSNEGPERLDAALRGVWLASTAGLNLQQFDIEQVSSRRRADEATLSLVHTNAFLKSFRDAGNRSREQGGEPVDLGHEVFVYPGSERAALTAVEAGLAAVDAVHEGRPAVMTVVRSPGHHAEPSRAMGYCLLSNAAIAARYAVDRGYFDKVAVLDIDIQRGNGTDMAFRLAPDDPEHFFLADIFMQGHEVNSYPETGEQQIPEAAQNIFRIGRPFGTDGAEWSAIVERELITRIKQFKPQLIIISAGFDCMTGDPNGGFDVSARDIERVTKLIAQMGLPIISFLEGGYDLDNLCSGVAAHCSALVLNR